MEVSHARYLILTAVQPYTQRDIPMKTLTKQQLGGYARANKLSPGRRQQIATYAAIVLWSQKRSSNRKVVTKKVFDKTAIGK